MKQPLPDSHSNSRVAKPVPVSLKTNISWLALGIGLVFSLALMWFSPLNRSIPVAMPLLMALFMAELGFLVTAAGAVNAIMEIRSSGKGDRLLVLVAGNLLLAANLLYVGYVLWPKEGF